MFKSNHSVNEGVQFRVLSPDQCADIHSAVIEVLENTGMVVKSKKALQLLKKGGAFVDDELVKIPGYLIEKAIRSAPSRIVLADRKGNRRIFLEGHNSYFGMGPTNVYINDPYTGKRRKPTQEDTANAIRVLDALPNIDFAMDYGTITDVPGETHDLHLLKIMLENTTKPIIHWAQNVKNQAVMVEMCAEIAGGLEELQKNPFVCFFTTASSPLLQTEQATERLMYLAENMIPNVHVSAPMSGGTAPVTPAGTVVIALAECLGGLLISQLVREGAPCFIGVVPGPVDMKTMIMSYGNPEFDLMHAAVTDMAHYYQLPLWSTAGCTDSKTVDQQSAIESTASILAAALSGANLIHDVGFIEGGITNDLGQMVMSDEIIGFARRFIQGIKVDGTTLATDVIKSVGPQGHFLSANHTYAHFRELWSPSLLDKNRYDQWVADGNLTMGDRILTKVKYLIENHQPEQLPPEMRVRLAEILAEADSK